MMVFYTPEAEQDVSDIYDWYESQRDGLGEVFLAYLGGLTKQLSIYPERWRVIYNGTRKAILRRFPYSVYYRLGSDRTILIVAVLHDRRDPDYVQDRI